MQEKASRMFVVCSIDSTNFSFTQSFASLCFKFKPQQVLKCEILVFGTYYQHKNLILRLYVSSLFPSAGWTSMNGHGFMFFMTKRHWKFAAITKRFALARRAHAHTHINASAPAFSFNWCWMSSSHRFNVETTFRYWRVYVRQISNVYIFHLKSSPCKRIDKNKLVHSCDANADTYESTVWRVFRYLWIRVFNVRRALNAYRYAY